MGRGPLVTDCDIKQLKWFEAYHGRGGEFTEQSKILIKNRLPGPPVQMPSLDKIVVCVSATNIF
jgi:hypothetical protein